MKMIFLDDDQIVGLFSYWQNQLLIIVIETGKERIVLMSTLICNLPSQEIWVKSLSQIIVGMVGCKGIWVWVMDSGHDF